MPSAAPNARPPRASAAALAALLAACSSPVEEPPAAEETPGYPRDGVLRLHHLQAEGTHNSYHVQPESDLVEPWNYTHAPLDDQLASQGVRQVELDVYWSEEDGRFLVLHVPLLDDVSTCPDLQACLGAVRGWSDAHPGHHPVAVQIEPKDPYDAEAADAYFQRLEEAIRAVWPAERVITPDEVKGAHATLAEAVTASGWPTLGTLRGRALFFLDAGGEYRDHYTFSGTSLDGRLAFATAEPADPPAPYAAVMVINDPVADAQVIRDAVAAGFLVRTRADTDGVEARAGDTSRLEAALASGAHFVSTDFPAPVQGIDYWVEIPSGTPSRCNPVTAPVECAPGDIEDPALLSAP